MERIETDLCVIGAGSGGLSIAAGASQMGARVVLIEGGEMGGDCLNYGCVPSKALIASARQAAKMRAGGALGVTPVEPSIDYADVMAHVRGAIDRIAPHDSQERFEGLGVRVIRDWARFRSDREVLAGDVIVSARRFVIATGSSPFVPPIPGLSDIDYLTNETLFDLREQPEHLIVIGGGPVGMEMAQAHRRLGCQVTLLEAATVLSDEDPKLAAALCGRFVEDGVRILENRPVESVRGEPGACVVDVAGESIAGTHLLVAAGRQPNTDRLNLDAAGIDHDRRGITVNSGLRTSNRRVYAIGDVAGQKQFTHVAGYHAGIVARAVLFGLPAKTHDHHIPHVVYTDPELAQIGLTEVQARQEHGNALEVIEIPFDASDRAIADATAEGQIRLIVHRGRPVGVSILGPGAGELIAVWALMMANGLKLKALAGTVLPYPTMNEISKRAAGAYFSPRLFDSAWVRRVVSFVQRHIP